MSAILYDDNFAQGLGNWQLSSSGAGSAPPSIVAGKAVLNVGPTLGAISQMFQQRYSRKLQHGLEVAWFLKNAQKQFEQWLYYKKPGQQRRTAKLKFDTFGKQIVIETTLGDIVVAPFDDTPLNAGVFAAIKFTVDFEAGDYGDVIIGGQTYNMSQHTIPTDSGVGDYQLLSVVMARHVNPASTNDPAVSTVTITADEL
jgi:hypothetical protein